ncbi:MAG: hypothetical protein V4608_00545 [Bacteroidota bacterium]
MLIIKKQQIEQIKDHKLYDFASTCQQLIKDEHPEIFKTRLEKDWNTFILAKIKAANTFGIYEAKSVYMYILTLAKNPQYFHPRMPQWAVDILTWPGRSEENKILELCKEVYNLNQPSL